MSAFYDLSKTPRNILNQAIVRAIVSENNGALFDPSDLSTLYQDAAGTTPVTAVEQPVGKMLNKSGNGYHATQSITASRPTLSARYNLLTKTEDFSDSAWSTSGYTAGCTVIPNAAMSPANTQTADKIIASTTLGAHNIGQLCASAIGKNFYYVNVKAAEIKQVALLVRLNLDVRYDRVIYDLEYGTVVRTDGTGGPLIPEIVNLGDGWYRVGVYINYSSTSTRVGVALINPSASDSTQGGVSYTGDGVSGLYLWGASLNIGQSAYRYQRVNTATDYDTDERYFKKYLRFDGVDDYLNLPYMGLYANGSASVVVAATVKPSTWSTILAEGSVDQNGLYILARYTSTNKLGTFIQDDNHNLLRNLETPITQGITTVLSVVDAGSAITHWVSSRLTGSSNYTRSGTLTSVATLVGARPYLDTLNGNLYSLIITKSALSDAQRIKCERYTASKAGVTL